jgi:hypothetical protein
MKKLLWLTVLALIGAGAYFGYKMAKGEGGWLSSCGGWGSSKSDPWTSYTPPADTATAPDTGTESGATA